MADDTAIADQTPGPLLPGAADVSALGTATTVAPDASLFVRGGAAPPRIAPQVAFPSPAVPPWLPNPAQQAQDTAISDVQSRVANLPLDQAQKAMVAAMKFQGQRGYQADLAAGKSAGEALAKWAPMLFYDRPATFAPAVRQAFTPQRPASRWVPPDPATGAPGHFESGVGTIHVPPATATPRAAKEGVLTPVEKDDLSYAEREADKLQTKQENDTQGARAFRTPTNDQTPGQKAAANAWASRQRQINAFQKKIDSYHSRVSQAAAQQSPTIAPPQGTTTGTTPAAPVASAAPSPSQSPVQAPLPLPKTKADLVVGQEYVTRQGRYRWDGTHLRRASQ